MNEVPAIVVAPSGVVIFLVWRHQFFLILRDDKPEIASPNTWCPVTGGRDDPENLYEAARRELVEEIGIEVTDFIMLGVSMKGNGFFFGRLTDEERKSIVLGEGQDYAFFTYDDLPLEKMSGAMLIYIKRYPEIFRIMAETEKAPYGSELGLATWNGKH
jgi:8-oxo-dGTP pyrophosphatase MutT (NUDIX family)